jgi:tRNA U38,U39,U40 pseudouridine synthase TruA
VAWHRAPGGVELQELLRHVAHRLLHPGLRALGEPDEITEFIVEKLDVVERGSFLDVEVSANRFLRRMVRTLVGTLLEIGQGKRPPEWIEEVLVARDRRAAGPVIAARGLCLVAVDYPTEPEEGGRR